MERAPLRGTLIGRVSNARVPTRALQSASVRLFDRYPYGATAVAPIAVPNEQRADGSFSFDVPPGRYWLGAHLGPFSTLVGPVTLGANSTLEDLVLEPDFVLTDVMSARSPEGPRLSWASVLLLDPSEGLPLNRASVTLDVGARSFTLQPIPYARGTTLFITDFGGSNHLVNTPELTLRLTAPELGYEVLTRHLATTALSDAPHWFTGSRWSPSSPLLPRSPSPDGTELRWTVPDDASYSLVCLLGASGALLLRGCDVAVSSPYWLDTTGLLQDREYEVLVRVGRAVATGEGTFFNEDEVRTPFQLAPRE